MYTKSIVQTLAKRAISNMLQGHVEMMRDEEGAAAIGDLTETIRDIALDCVEDMMNDLKFDVINEIKQMKFTAKIESTLKFDDERMPRVLLNTNGE